MILYTFLYFLFPSCVYDHYDLPPVDKSHITLHISLPAMGETRSLNFDDENDVETIDILLFNTSDNKYVQTIPGRDIKDVIPGETDRKKFEVDLPFGSYHMIFIANSTDQIDAVALDDSMDKNDVIGAVLFEMSDKWVEDLQSFTPFPMWGELTNVQIEKDNVLIGGSTDIKNVTIPMLRSVVRIDIKLEQRVLLVTGGGKLVSAYLYNRYTKGQVIPDDGKVTFTSTDPGYEVSAPSIPSGANKTLGPLIYLFNPGIQELTYTIYTFEAGKGSFENLLENTCLVLGLGEFDNGGGVVRWDNNRPSQLTKADPTYPNMPVWFYRVDFTLEESGATEYLPLLRNHQYVITVKDIINRGFPEPSQAFRSEPYGIDYTVVPWGTYDFDAENGIYRLDISSTFLELQKSGKVVQITTTHPDGWSAYISEYPDKIEGNGGNAITYWDASNSNKSYFDNPLIDLPAGHTFNLYIEPGNPGEDNIETRYIHIVSGNITNVITVKTTGYRVE